MGTDEEGCDCDLDPKRPNHTIWWRADPRASIVEPGGAPRQAVPECRSWSILRLR